MDSIRVIILKKSKVVTVAMKVLIGLFLLSVFLTVAGIVWVIVSEESFLRVFSITVDSKIVLAELLIGVISEGMLLVIFFTIYSMFHAISVDGLPFTHQNAARLKSVGKKTIVYSIVLPVVRGVFYKVLVNSADISSGFNLVFIIFSILFYCTALIFQYGAELQKQSDETL